MVFIEKYIKYQQKINILTKMKGGNPPETPKFAKGQKIPLGINYEGGKIIKHIKNRYSNILSGYSNFQIAMDAPFDDMEAPEELRAKGPAEKIIPDYNYMNNKSTIFNALIEVVNFCCASRTNTIVFQIARGRSGFVFFNDDIIPNLKLLGNIEFLGMKDNKYTIYKFNVCGVEKRIILTFGYRSTDYFNMPSEEIEGSFVFVNIGMYARLDFNPKITSGMLCVPVETYSMVIEDDNKVIKDKLEFSDDILLRSAYKFEKIRLIGIADDMPFVTTKDYKLGDFFE
jgi:hypothetical protein